MDRRIFLKSSVLSAVALGTVPSLFVAAPLLPGGKAPGPPAPAPPGPSPEPEFVAFGSPYRKSADPVASTGDRGRGRERMRGEMIHHRMPPVWRDRLHLGIRE